MCAHFLTCSFATCIGPIKTKARVEEKMNNDYEGIFLRVVDVVRSSAVFHSLLELNAAVVGGLVSLNALMRPSQSTDT